jgi:hypothetical protein
VPRKTLGGGSDPESARRPFNRMGEDDRAMPARFKSDRFSTDGVNRRIPIFTRLYEA